MRHQGAEQRRPPRYPVRWVASDGVVDAVGYPVSEGAGVVTGSDWSSTAVSTSLLNMFGPTP